MGATFANALDRLRASIAPATAGARGSLLVCAALAGSMSFAQLLFAHRLADDFMLRGILHGEFEGLERPVWDLYRFLPGGESTAHAIGVGGIPWFSSPELKLAFLRPLSSLLFAFDDAFLGGSVVAQQLHSGLWYVALCAGVAWYFQRRLGGLGAGLAGAVFALAACHQQSVGWLAARNGLVSATLSVVALGAHELCRETGRTRYRWLSVGAAALALGAGEMGLGALCLIAARELSEAPLRWRRAARALWPTLGVTALYVAVYVLLGYGAHGSGIYLEPLHDPLAYLAQLPRRLLASVGALFLSAPAALWLILPKARPVLVGIGAVAGLLLVAWVAVAYRLLAQKERAFARFALWATILSLLPQMAGSLGPRSFLVASVGSSALIGLGVARGLAAAKPLRGWWLWRGAASAALLLHLVVAPLQWLRSASFARGLAQASQARLDEVPLRTDRVAEQAVVVLTAPDALLGMFGPFQLAAGAGPIPAQWHSLSLAERDHEVEMLSKRAVELTVLEGDLLDSGFAELFRNPKSTFHVGQRLSNSILRATIVEVSERGQPVKVRFDFERALDDPSLLVIAWHEGHMQQIRLSPGERRRLAWKSPF